MCCVANNTLHAQIWLENFSGAPPAPGWSQGFIDCDGTAVSFAGVRNGRFEVQDMEGNCCPALTGGDNDGYWQTGEIDIANRCNVGISVQYGSIGAFECVPGGPYFGCIPCNPPDLPSCITDGHDQMVFEYRIDGGPWVQFGYVCGGGAGAFTATALSGGTLEIRINATNKSTGETYWFDNVTVTGAPGPVMNPVADITVCPSPPNVTVSFSGGQPGTVYQWVNSNTATGIAASGSTNNNMVFTAANVTSQQVSTITVTPRLGACPGTPQTFNVTVNPRPVATNPGPRTFCAGDPIDIPITGTPPTSNYNWTVSNTNTGLPASGSGNVTGTANTVTTTQTATVVITPNDNGCNGPTANFTVTVSPRPTMNPVADVHGQMFLV